MARREYSTDTVYSERGRGYEFGREYTNYRELKGNRTTMLQTEEEIKRYVRTTIKLGNKERIAKVLKRFEEWKKENRTPIVHKTDPNDIVAVAKQIFF